MLRCWYTGDGHMIRERLQRERRDCETVKLEINTREQFKGLPGWRVISHNDFLNTEPQIGDFLFLHCFEGADADESPPPAVLQFKAFQVTERRILSSGPGAHTMGGILSIVVEYVKV